MCNLFVILLECPPFQTMTFYEGGEASNGEAPSMLDASASSAVDSTSDPDTSMNETTAAPEIVN